DELKKVIQNWNLDSKVFIIIMDGGSNMIKVCHFLTSKFGINRLPCAAHTLQFSVQAGIKQLELIHTRLKSLQAFFRSPKQAQRLREEQKKLTHEDQDINNDPTANNSNQWNPLDILTDCKTRWNSTYLAWKRILKLDDAIRSLAATLSLAKDTQTRNEGERLNRLRLNSEEFNFIENIIKLLAPFEAITRQISGAKYPTISLIYPYMRLLKQKFAPTDNVTIEDYMDLIYELLNRVRAAVYLSLDELWNIPDDVALLATILELRLKETSNFQQVEELDTLFVDMWAPSQEIIQAEEDEIA
ncbi:7679_t:CDS:2, partial [Acaulospora morrowiae]